ncbi:hypothetical protein ESCOCK358M_25265 [Escherichia coli]
MEYVYKEGLYLLHYIPLRPGSAFHSVFLCVADPRIYHQVHKNARHYVDFDSVQHHHHERLSDKHW